MLKVVRSEVVTQHVHAGESVTLHKEVLCLQTENPLWVVRKHLPSGASKASVVLVHGFAQNRYSWHTSIRSMSAWLAQQGFDVYNLELRGHGRSKNEGRSRPADLQQYIDDLISIAKALPDSAYWIGHSLGAAVIYGAAATMRPLRCKGAIGVAGVFRFATHNIAMRTLCGATEHLAKLPLLKNIQIHTKNSGLLFSQLYRFLNAIGYVLPVSGWWPDTIERELVEERLTVGFDWLSVPIWKDMCFIAKNKRFLYEQEWSETDVPVLVLLGDRDHFLFVQDGRPAYTLARSVHRKLVIFDDYHHQHHWGHLDIVLGKDAPKFVWPEIQRWIEEIEAHNTSGNASSSAARSSAN